MFNTKKIERLGDQIFNLEHRLFQLEGSFERSEEMIRRQKVCIEQLQTLLKFRKEDYIGQSLLSDRDFRLSCSIDLGAIKRRCYTSPLQSSKEDWGLDEMPLTPPPKPTTRARKATPSKKTSRGRK